MLDGWLRWPGLGQVLLATGELQREVRYAVTSLAPQQAGPKALEALWRGHWNIENRVHYVRDVTMGEDAGQAYTGSTPQALATLRNCIIRYIPPYGLEEHSRRFETLRRPPQPSPRPHQRHPSSDFDMTLYVGGAKPAAYGVRCYTNHPSRPCPTTSVWTRTATGSEAA